MVQWESGTHPQQEDPRLSQLHFKDLIVSPFPVYKSIQSYNTQPHRTKMILINLLKPRTSKWHYGGCGYFSSGSAPSVNTKPHLKWGSLEWSQIDRQELNLTPVWMDITWQPVGLTAWLFKGTHVPPGCLHAYPSTLGNLQPLTSAPGRYFEAAKEIIPRVWCFQALVAALFHIYVSINMSK